METDVQAFEKCVDRQWAVGAQQESLAELPFRSSSNASSGVVPFVLNLTGYSGYHVKKKKVDCLA